MPPRDVKQISPREFLGEDFELVDLRELRFDEAPQVPVRFLGGSYLVSKR